MHAIKPSHPRQFISLHKRSGILQEENKFLCCARKDLQQHSLLCKSLVCEHTLAFPVFHQHTQAGLVIQALTLFQVGREDGSAAMTVQKEERGMARE